MSRQGNCWDNAVAENFFRILKYEFSNHVNFHNLNHVKLKMAEFIEILYNRKQPHSKLGYMSPYFYYNYKMLNSA